MSSVNYNCFKGQCTSCRYANKDYLTDNCNLIGCKKNNIVIIDRGPDDCSSYKKERGDNHFLALLTLFCNKFCTIIATTATHLLY